MNNQQRIAEDATFQIACAMQHIDFLRSVLYVLRDRLDEQESNRQYATVAELAIFNADDWHNQLDVERETLEKRTSEASAASTAPQKTTDEFVVRIPLAEFSKGRQAFAGSALGISMAAVSQALKAGRDIYVTPKPDGSFSAFEMKPFPGRNLAEADQ